MSIETKNLSYIYSPNTPFSCQALNDISLTIEEGEFFGIIGHTGSGKSTLIQHFNVLQKPQSGEVYVFGQNVSDRKTNLKEIRSRVGMVFQYPEYQLFAETVFDDVAFGLKNFFNTKEKPLSKDDIETAVVQALTAVGLDPNTVRNRSPFELSGGQKRRVAIAGVIVGKPEVLILDEPTAGLDPSGKREILTLIHDLKKSFCKTIIMIGHDMDEMASHCTKLCVMADGKVKYVLPPAELFKLASELEQLHLELPTTIQITNALTQKGFDIQENVFEADELANQIDKALIAQHLSRQK